MLIQIKTPYYTGWLNTAKIYAIEAKKTKIGWRTVIFMSPGYDGITVMEGTQEETEAWARTLALAINRGENRWEVVV